MIDFLLHGILHWSILAMVTFLLITTHITNVAVSLYLHRSQAHRAVTFHPIIEHFFRGYLWLFTGMITKEWVAIHRKHHVHCDTHHDPHSPLFHGIKKVLFAGVTLYRTAAKDQACLEQYGKNTPNDWLERHIYCKNNPWGILLSLVIELACFGIIALPIWIIQMIWMPFWGAGVVNGLGHYIGYRNNSTEDNSKNLSPFGILLAGEELHNNHHYQPASGKFSLKPWEFDIGWMYIKLLEFLRLAKVKNQVMS